ncbi:MAG: hypothetical protein QXQ33_00640 [Nitrososphaerota archaeon]
MNLLKIDVFKQQTKLGRRDILVSKCIYINFLLKNIDVKDMVEKDVKKLKKIMKIIDFHSEIYELMEGKKIVSGSVILSNEFKKTLLNDYPNSKHADISYENIEEDAVYELVEDLVFRLSYYRLLPSIPVVKSEKEFDLIYEITKTIETLANAGLPMVIYENPNPAFYIIRVLIFKKIS